MAVYCFNIITFYPLTITAAWQLNKMKFYFTFFTEVKNSINWSEKEEFANEPNGLGEKKKQK